MEKAIPIKTQIGFFENYRDGIILKRIDWKNCNITFHCNIVSNSIVDNVDNGEDYDSELTFVGVISLFHAEYDTYESIKNGFPMSNLNESIFEEIENSDYIKRLPIRADQGEVKHYCLSTYDDVFNIIAKSYICKLL